MCIGRVGLMQCREKCLSDGAERTTARCVRQHEFPFQKRCLCQVRRSPMHTVDGGSHKVGKNPALRNTTEMPIKRALLEKLSKEKKRNPELDVGDVPLLKEDVCTENNGDEVCDRKCSSNDTNSSGRCQADGDRVVCRCSPCLTLVCDFEKNMECGWTDMHMIDEQFGNVSIASKLDQSRWTDMHMIDEQFGNVSIASKLDQKNRYGLSRIPSSSYSGLYRRGPFDGPITLTVDVYPTEGIDVRICIDTLQKCQTQKVTAKSWNRVRAKIKVKQAQRVCAAFMLHTLFYNTS
ncbi:unnamed protein product [Strongylus vulgaris]|uniref:Uncharacterized protein n=1 Tax=Strongylus vulgaris TaxID=40348 RepID=A0A3P7IW71_STRVU|nr:unnamed protein product [Strongylus vulgaris]